MLDSLLGQDWIKWHGSMVQTHLILVYQQKAGWDFNQEREPYTESISILTSTAKCNCYYMIPTHHTEHCVWDMNEQSNSYHSATLCVTACLPASP